MDRRSFLKLFAAAVPVAAVAPTYFFAPAGGWKSGVIVSPIGSLVSDRMYYLGENGIYENGLLISEAVDPELWGLQYWQVATGGPYMGIERSGVS